MKAIMRDEREMKDSGIEWIENIPINWKIAKIRNVIQPGKDGIKIGPFGSALTNKTSGDAEYKIYGQANLVSGDFSDTKNKISKEIFIELQNYEVIPGDICISMMGTIGKCLTVPYGISKGIMDSHLIKIRLKETVDNRFFEYVYDKDKGGICFTQMQYEKKGSIMDGLNTTIVKGLYLPLPNLEEQQVIADYLDDHCSKIDAIIAEAKASIEEYQELKQAVIYEAVTKGLDKTVEMKDSGVEWVEKIPNNWHIVKITRILDKEHPYAIGDGDHGSIKTEQYRDSGIPFIRVQNLGWGTALNMDNVVYISEEDNKQIQNSTLSPNDILFAKTGATIGKTAIMPEEIPIANTTSHVGKISISKEHNSRYIFYVLSSQIGYRQFWDIAMQKTTRPELSIEETKSIKVVLPADKTIEDSIVNYLDEKIPVFDDMINTKASLIEDLEAYKKSLIYEVVTGKRKVGA